MNMQAPKRQMDVLDHTGHTKHIWDSDNEDEVAAMRTLFTTLTREKGYRAYHVGRGGDQGEPMTSFDEEAESMILTPAMRGG